MEKYFLKSFSVISGRKAVEGLESVCVEIFAVTVLADFSIEVKSEVEGMKVNLFFSTSTVNHNQDKNPGVNLKDYYSNHLKNRKHQLKHIKFLSDDAILETFNGLGFKPLIIRGSQAERVNEIINVLNLPTVMHVEEAIEKAKIIIQENRESVSKRIIDQYKEPSWREKAEILTTF